ncbi:MAG: hypothetical protein A3H59_02570 [Candidatus Jacksonbacteria bacterium RIFCSPLOWO2_02_FULL_43_9]|nr:MAG: hypothetical protein A3H59_02570 [Candidatus Jacksonbacteria bacterium RIFCSPLOWO2_02_FULL_43_9]
MSAPRGSAAERVYHGVSATTVNGRDIVVLSNQQGIETLEISGNKLIKRGEANQPGNIMVGVYARSQGSKAEAYVAAGPNILKFDISDINAPKMVASKVYFGHAYDVHAAGQSDIVFAGTRGITLHEADSLDQLSNYFVQPAYGVAQMKSGAMVVTTDDEALVIKKNGAITHRQALSGSDKRLRKPYADQSGNSYAPGDDMFIKVGTGVNFSNWSGYTYAMSGVDSEPYVYGVNGWGVYKLGKQTLALDDFTSINERGGWATNVTAFPTSSGIRVVVTAKQQVYLLDEHLNILDTYTYQPYPSTSGVVVSQADSQIESPKGKALSAWVSSHDVRYNTFFSAYGSGFWPGEEVTAEFGPYHPVQYPQTPSKIYPNPDNASEIGWADANGNVKVANIYVKEFPLMRTDISNVMQVTLYGKQSGLTYSTNINVLPGVKPAEIKKDEPKKDETKKVVESSKRCERTIEKTTEEIIRDGKKVVIEKVVEKETCTQETK